MRPIETILIVANLLSFFSLIIPLPQGRRWIRYLVPITTIIAVAQAAIEGPRWQMIPVYVLTLVLFVIWLLGILKPNGIHRNRLLAGLGIALGLLSTLVSILLPIVFPVFGFPRPTGPYAIGTTTYHWVDTGRPELFTTDPNDHRELMVQVWYPAKDEPSALRAPYIQDADSVTPAMARVTRLPNFFLTHFKYVTTNAVVSAPIAENQATYPVLIFLSGLGGYRQSNTFQVEELVSHGYIVVGLDQPGASALVRFPDGRQVPGLLRDDIQPSINQSIEPLPETPTINGQVMTEGIIPYLAADVPFALDQLTALNQADPNQILTGHLDLDRIGIFGISLGAINTGEACAKKARLKACLMMDAAMPGDAVKTGLKRPSMWITRDADTMRLERARSGGWTEKDIAQAQTTMRALYERLPGDGYFVQIPGMFHLNLLDTPYWSPLLPQLGLTGTIDGQRIFDIVNAYSVAFFDKELKGQPSSLLNKPSSPYPEVIFEAR